MEGGHARNRLRGVCATSRAFVHCCAIKATTPPPTPKSPSHGDYILKRQFNKKNGLCQELVIFSDYQCPRSSAVSARNSFFFFSFARGFSACSSFLSPVNIVIGPRNWHLIMTAGLRKHQRRLHNISECKRRCNKWQQKLDLTSLKYTAERKNVFCYICLIMNIITMFSLWTCSGHLRVALLTIIATDVI